MTTFTYSIKWTLRPYMKPLLLIAALTKCSWLTDICFKKEVIPYGQDVELRG